MVSIGGWTVFLKRFDGSVDFKTTWENYKNGFGSVNEEFWLGNEMLTRITNSGTYTLRIDLIDFDDEAAYAKYPNFVISSEADNYKLSIGMYNLVPR